MDVARFYRHVVHVARRESATLCNLDKGVFFVPERAFVYLVGKEVLVDAAEVFGTDSLRWRTEAKVGQLGPVDLVIDVEGHSTIALEFKMRGDANNITADLDKLATLDALSYRKYFCALIDAWADGSDADSRLKAVRGWRGAGGLQAIPVTENFDSFETKDEQFATPIRCVVGLWEVADNLT